MDEHLLRESLHSSELGPISGLPLPESVTTRRAIKSRCNKCEKLTDGLSYWVSARFEKDSEGLDILKETFRGWLCHDCNFERRTIYYEPPTSPESTAS